MFIQNPDGSQNQLEVFTKEEVEAKIADGTKTATEAAGTAAKETYDKQIEEYKTANPSGAAEIETLKGTIADNETKIKELEGEGGTEGGTDPKDEQIKRLKEESAESTKILNEKIETMGNQINDALGDKKDSLIKAAAKGDVELEKKITLHYDSFAGDLTKEAEIAERVANAVTLSTPGTDAPGNMDNASNPGGTGTNPGGSSGEDNKTESTPEVKAFQKNMGISEADAKQFGPGGDNYHEPSTNN